MLIEVHFKIGDVPHSHIHRTQFKELGEDYWTGFEIGELAFNLNIFKDSVDNIDANVYLCTNKNPDGTWNNDNSIELHADVTEYVEPEKKFPNGFQSWQETHFEVSVAFKDKLEIWSQLGLDVKPSNIVEEAQEGGGRAEVCSLAVELTDEFEKKYEGVKWGEEELDFFDTIDDFLREKLATFE